MLAAANLLSSAGLFVAAGVYWLLAVGLHLGPRGVFAIGALMTLAATVYVVWLLPDSLLRFVLWLLTHTVYRIRVEGRDNIPGKGGALFVCNHLSFVDALLLLASTDRQVRFIMFKDIYEQPLGQALRPDPARHPHLLRAAPARDAPVAAHGQRGHPERRGGLHLRRGPDHAHRPAAAVPARLRADHEGRGGADHPGGSGRRVGQHLQLREGALPLEAAAPDSLSRDGELRPAAAAHGDARSRCGRRAGTHGRGVAASEGAHETAAPRLCADGPPASVPVRDGRRARRPR